MLQFKRVQEVNATEICDSNSYFTSLSPMAEKCLLNHLILNAKEEGKGPENVVHM